MRHVLDFSYEGANSFAVSGWPNYTFVDAAGVVRLQCVGLDRNWMKILKALRGASVPAGAAAPATPLAPAGELDPALAAAPDGGVWLAFEKDGDIRLRRIGDPVPGEDLTVTSSDANDHSPALAVAVDGSVWVAWSSLRDGRYDIFARCFAGGEWSARERITTSADDAMNPALAIDGAGRVWVTYYEWNRNFRTSRDRDVFARYRDGGGWSGEIRVSPPEPAVEDHTDPAILADPRHGDRVWIAWSYDYHPTLCEDPEDADQPTIFARQVGPDGPVGDRVFLVGTPGEYQHAVDLWPSLAADPNGAVFCAYDYRPGSGGRGAMLAAWTGEEFEPPEEVVMSTGDFHSPALAIDAAGTKAVVWAERIDGRFRIRGSLDEGDGFADPVDLMFSDGALRAPAIAAAGDGSFWLACEEQVGAESKIRVERLGP